MDIVNYLKNQVIISVQAAHDEPLYAQECMNAMMQSVINGGAKALRLAGERDIKNAKKMFNIPVIGITKPKVLPENWREIAYITPTIEDVKILAAAGADIIAFDGTDRKREKNSLEEIITAVKSAGKIAMADISTYEEGITAAALGADIVSTTLSGYTQNSFYEKDEPDFELLKSLVNVLSVPVILEGRVWEVAQVKEAFEHGAHAVVIGSAVTRPQLIVKRFMNWR